MTMVTPVSGEATPLLRFADELPPEDPATQEKTGAKEPAQQPPPPLVAPSIVNRYALALATQGTTAPASTSTPKSAPADPTHSGGSGVLGWLGSTFHSAVSTASTAVDHAAPIVESGINTVTSAVRTLDAQKASLGTAIDSGEKFVEHKIDDGRAWLRNNGGVVGRMASDQIGFTEGAAVSLYDTGKGLVQMADGAGALANPLEWMANPSANIDRLKSAANTVEAVGKIANLANPSSWINDPQGNSKIAGALWNSAVSSFKADPAKFLGNATATVATMFVPGADVAGGVADAGRAAEVATDATRVLDAAQGSTKALSAARDADQVANTAKDVAQTTEATQATDAAKTAKAAQEAPAQAAAAPKPAGTIFSGHGNYYPKNGTLTVPEGTSITVYSEHGATITDSLGNVIETGSDTSKVFKKTFDAGSEMPNYTLSEPKGLNIKGNPTTVTKPTPLSDLLKPGMGDCHWAACTYDPTAAAAKQVFGIKGVLDKATQSWLKVYK